MLADKTDDALMYGKRALDIASSIAGTADQEWAGNGDQAWARYVIGRAYCAMGDGAIDAAEQELEEAKRIALACDALPLVACCQTMLGEIHRRRGAQAKSRDCVAAADVIYAKLDMRPLLLDSTR